MNYEDNIKDLRVNNKLSQEDIANILGISRGTYSHYETENIIIPINHLITLCDYFNASIDYIFGFETYKQKNFNNTNEKIAGMRLKEWRKNGKITQEQLAEELNTNRSVIANYERGRNYIATPFLYTLCKKYHISADYLIGRIDNIKYLSK